MSFLLSSPENRRNKNPVRYRVQSSGQVNEQCKPYTCPTLLPAVILLPLWAHFYSLTYSLHSPSAPIRNTRLQGNKHTRPLFFPFHCRAHVANSRHLSAGGGTFSFFKAFPLESTKFIALSATRYWHMIIIMSLVYRAIFGEGIKELGKERERGRDRKMEQTKKQKNGVTVTS